MTHLGHATENDVVISSACNDLVPNGMGVLKMEALQHFSAMEAFCRQRAKMDGEDVRFWLTEAEMLAKLAADANKKALQSSRFS